MKRNLGTAVYRFWLRIDRALCERNPKYESDPRLDRFYRLMKFIWTKLGTVWQ